MTGKEPMAILDSKIPVSSHNLHPTLTSRITHHACNYKTNERIRVNLFTSWFIVLCCCCRRRALHFVLNKAFLVLDIDRLLCTCRRFSLSIAHGTQTEQIILFQSSSSSSWCHLRRQRRVELVATPLIICSDLRKRPSQESRKCPSCSTKKRRRGCPSLLWMVCAVRHKQYLSSQ